VDEKSAIQALDGLDPVLPLSPGRAEQHGFEYYRHGTLSLLAALEVRTGKVVGKTAPRHTSAEFIDFTDVVGTAKWASEIHIVPKQSVGAQNQSCRRVPASKSKGAVSFQAYSTWQSSQLARLELEPMAPPACQT
jgi:hypothetical protein